MMNVYIYIHTVNVLSLSAEYVGVEQYGKNSYTVLMVY